MLALLIPKIVEKFEVVARNLGNKKALDVLVMDQLAPQFGWVEVSRMDH